jgi:hypothetical protein
LLSLLHTNIVFNIFCSQKEISISERAKLISWLRQGKAMQRGLGGFRRERLHQEGKRERGKGTIKCVINFV